RRVAVAVLVAHVLARLGLEKGEDVVLVRDRREAERWLVDANHGTPLGSPRDPAVDRCGRWRRRGAEILGITGRTVAERDHRVGRVAVAVVVFEIDPLVEGERELVGGSLVEALELHLRG